MRTDWPLAPWVAEHRDRLGFDLQVFPSLLAAAGIQYFVVQTHDAADEETIRLLAEVVIPAAKVRR